MCQAIGWETLYMGRQPGNMPFIVIYSDPAREGFSSMSQLNINRTVSPQYQSHSSFGLTHYSIDHYLQDQYSLFDQ